MTKGEWGHKKEITRLAGYEELQTKPIVLKRHEHHANKNNEYCSLTYPKQPKTTFFGCLTSIEITRLATGYA
ncbi:hypothetical protein ACG1VR_01345 [Cedecea davisae]|uniref:hypothetical protein n=1 Tax=Cedecea davisae TaxID=158484 RepID=UPI00376EFABC